MVLQANERYKSLDSLRGLAAIQVVLMHMIDIFVQTRCNQAQTNCADNPEDPLFYIFHSPLKFIWEGNSAVILFFVLSGFVLSLQYDKSDQKFDFPAYFFRRLVRLYLPCIILLIVVKLLHGAIYQPGKFVENIVFISDFWRNPLTSKSFIHVMLLDDFFKLYVPPMYTIPIEIKLSLILPLFLFWYKRMTGLWRLLILPIFIICWSVLVSFKIIEVLPALHNLYFFSFFIAGSILYRFRDTAISLLDKLPNIPFMLVIAAAMLSYTASSFLWLLPEPLSSLVRNYSAYASMLASAIFITAVLGKRLRSRFETPLLVALGKISFSVYLTHMVTFAFGFFILYPALHSLALTVVILCICILPVSIVFYRFIENPSTKLSRRIK